MYKPNQFIPSGLQGNPRIVGETIEQKIHRIVHNKETIKDGAPLIFTERKEGVMAAYNIRTDRWEIATDAMDAIHKQKAAKREGKAEMKVVKDDKNDGGAEPTQGTGAEAK